MKRDSFCIVYVFWAFIILGSLMVRGQAPRNDRAPVIQARFIPDSVAIGDQFILEVTVSRDLMQVVEFPVFENGTLGGVIEILEETGVDTVSQDGRRLVFKKEYRLTTFEDGVINLGRYPMLYADKNILDTLWSADSLLLQVGTFEIDTLTQTIYDIKGNLDSPVRAGEFLGYLLIGLGALAAIALVIWLIIRRKRIIGEKVSPEPPHVQAIKALETLHYQKLWQNKKHKQYYTRLTDILREYIEKRYGITAMEMTSDEILETLHNNDLPAKSFADLGNILKTSDLVKFAKYVPENELNETLYTDAYYFIEATKPTIVEEVTDTEQI